jgi:hypothetical protein
MGVLTKLFVHYILGYTIIIFLVNYLVTDSFFLLI